jgi:quercetin dioxygenase-like cupin family protein
VQKVSEGEFQFRHGNSGPKYLFRGPNIDWGVLVLLPGESLGLHHHEKVEETFYFLEGSSKVYVNGQEYQAKAGDAFRMEAQDKHDIVNDTDGPVKMVFIKYPYLPKDKVDDAPGSGKY